MPSDTVRRISWPGSYAVGSAVVAPRRSLPSTPHARAVIVDDFQPSESKSEESCDVGSFDGLNSVIPKTPTQSGASVVPALTSRNHLRLSVSAPRGSLVV